MPLPNNESKHSQPFPRKKKDRERIHFPRYIVLFLAFIAFSACGPSVQEQSKTVESATQTIYPEIVPSDTVILNPGTGLYEWRGHNYIEAFKGIKISYNRFSWRELEPTEGEYDFSAIDRAIEKAASEGKKFAFRVRDLIPDEGDAIPDYLLGYSFIQNGIRIPDYNDGFFQERRNAFLKALGERYNFDPRIAYIDIGMFGNYGEWHLFGVDYNQVPEGFFSPSEETKRMIIDKYIEYFPNVQLLLFVNNPDNTDVIIYAIQKYADLENPLGTRNDCMGDEHFGRMFDLPQWQYLQFQWKVGPMVTEFCGVKTTDLLLAPQQVIDGHVSLVSNGNMGKRPKELSPEEIDAVTEAGNQAGYRFALREIIMPKEIFLNEPFEVHNAWVNLGNAPAYNDFVAYLQFRDPETGEVVFEMPLRVPFRCSSILDSTCLLPIEEDQEFIDNFVIEENNIPIPNGGKKFNMTIEVRNDNDPIGENMILANEGVNPEGILNLGEVVIRNPQ